MSENRNDSETMYVPVINGQPLNYQQVDNTEFFSTPRYQLEDDFEIPATEATEEDLDRIGNVEDYDSLSEEDKNLLRGLADIDSDDVVISRTYLQDMYYIVEHKVPEKQLDVELRANERGRGVDVDLQFEGRVTNTASCIYDDDGRLASISTGSDYDSFSDPNVFTDRWEIIQNEYDELHPQSKEDRDKYMDDELEKLVNEQDEFPTARVIVNTGLMYLYDTLDSKTVRKKYQITGNKGECDFFGNRFTFNRGANAVILSVTRENGRIVEITAPLQIDSQLREKIESNNRQWANIDVSGFKIKIDRPN